MERNAVQKEIQYAQRPQLFWNDGNGQMQDVSKITGGLFDRSLVARGLAVGDLDQDGDLDVLITTNGGPAHVLRNDGPGGHSISVNLRGAAPNLDALGARVTVTSGELSQEALVRSGSSYLSHSSTVLTFGLGDQDRVDHLRIRWPDGTEQSYAELPAGSTYNISQGEGRTGRVPYKR